jgi:hypothetical protein
MLRLTLPLAAVALLGGLASLVVVAVGGRSLNGWLVPLMQAVVIAALANALWQARRRGITSGFALVPAWTKVVLPMVAVAGGGLMATNLIGAMPRVSPSGQKVHSYSASAASGECRATYNKTENLVVPMKACEALARTASLAFVGAWLLFGSVGLWFALLVANADESRVHGG